MTRTTRSMLLAILFAGAIIVSSRSALAQPPNVVIQCNEILQTLYSPAPSPALRALPMLDIAMSTRST